MPAPDGLTGNVLAALAAAGAFRPSAVLVGSVAFQCYLPMLGFRAPVATTANSLCDIGERPG